MTGAPGPTMVKEMGYSLTEFARVLPPAMRDQLIGRITAKALAAGQLFRWEDIA